MEGAHLLGASPLISFFSVHPLSYNNIIIPVSLNRSSPDIKHRYTYCYTPKYHYDNWITSARFTQESLSISLHVDGRDPYIPSPEEPLRRLVLELHHSDVPA